MEYTPNAEYRQEHPLAERADSQRENILDLLSVLEEDVWFLGERLQEAQMTVKRLFKMEEMLKE